MLVVSLIIFTAVFAKSSLLTTIYIFTSETVMPSITASTKTYFTSSSLKGLIIA